LSLSLSPSAVVTLSLSAAFSSSLFLLTPQVLDEAKRKPFYIVPTQRYTYEVPRGIRKDEKVKTSPFLSFWYADFITETAPCIAWWRQEEAKEENKAKESQASQSTQPRKKAKHGREEAIVPAVEKPVSLPGGTMLIGDSSKLPHRMRAQYDKSRKRLRKKQREAIKRRSEEKKRKHRRQQAALRRASWR
jgi:hypothetical protein